MRRHGYFPFGEYMSRWYAVEALIEAAEASGEDPFEITLDDLNAVLPPTFVH